MTMAPYEGYPPAPPNGWLPVPQQQQPRPPSQLEKLGEWAQAADAAYSVAQKLVVTSFCPEQFRGKPAEATAAILSGTEVGLSPMASLRAFDIIQGTAAPKAITHRAVVLAAGHDLWLTESNADRAIVKGRRRGSEFVQESVWTFDRARRLNLTGKKNWKEQPEAMLIARATSECARLVASDALLGIPYSAEELMDGVVPELVPVGAVAPEVAAQAEPARRTAQRRNAPAKRAPSHTTPAAAQDTAPAGPPLPGEEEDYAPAEEPPVEDDGPPADMITKPQLTKLAICLKEAGLTERERGLQFMTIVTGRKVSSSKELTKDEASGVIDTLDKLTNEQIAAMIDTDSGVDDDGQLTIGDTTTKEHPDDPPF